MDDLSLQGLTLSSFNDEIIWDNHVNLFDKYFKDLFYKNGHKIIHHSLREGMKFNDAVKILKNL
jgi:hypothetical protein